MCISHFVIRMLWIYIVGIALNCGFRDICFGHSHIITTTLYDDLFTSKAYNSQLLPVCKEEGNVTLQVQTALRQIVNLNERDQVLTVNVWLRLKWNDCRLVWNSSAYGHIDHFTVPYSTVWVPDITLYDSAAEEEMMPGKEDYRVSIFNDGTLTYNFPTVIKSVCRVDVTYFPFDTQICSLQFGSWSYHGLELDVISQYKEADITTYIKHNEWRITEVPVVRHVLYYACCAEPYPDVTFYVKMARKPQFYVMTVLFPCILTSIVAMLSFMLPSESGEKVSLGITVLLSLAVFLLLVSESMPASSDSFPYIGMYFASSMVLVSLSCFMTVLVLNIHFKGVGGRTVPIWIRRYIINGLGSLLCVVKTKTYAITPKESPVSLDINGIDKKDEDGKTTESDGDKTGYVSNLSTKDILWRTKDPLVSIMKDQSKSLKQLEKHLCKNDAIDVNIDEWQVLSRVLDRLCLIIYIFSTIVTSGVFLGLITNGG